jgi:CMP-2-keto-3-deoxyoctulosonic acid synthetase
VGFFNDALAEYLAVSHLFKSNLEDLEEVRLLWKVREDVG